MDQLSLLEIVDRYHRNELSDTERVAFEQMRKSNPELDQLVVEHHFFVGQLNKYGDRKRFKSVLQDIHHTLQESGEIKPVAATGKGRIISLWARYRRVVAVAASIAGVTALLISGLAAIFGPKAPIRDIEELRRKVTNLEKQSSNQTAQINDVRSKIDPATPIKFGGTSFLIDPKGYLATSAHVIQDAAAIYVQNNKGQDFRATLVHKDPEKDLAILRIEDTDFKPLAGLPYSISRAASEQLAEPVFTLGYPKEEVVYGEGYLSAKTGMKGDTLAFQLSISANPGNSGGPVLNQQGEVIGILNARETKSQGVVFATKAKNIVRIVEELKKNDPEMQIKVSARSSIRGLERVQQVKKVQDCVYMVKVVL